MTLSILSCVVAAAFIHAFWNILLKRAQGGLSFLWFVFILQGFVFAPWIAWVIWSDRPELDFTQWFFIGGSALIHIAYYFFLQRGYRAGDISLVYPIARGTGPVLSSLIAVLFLGERPGVLGILGIASIGVGIFFLADGIPGSMHPKSRVAVVAGLLTGGSIALYTVWDKYAVSVVHLSPVLLDLLANPVQALLLTPLVGSEEQIWLGIGRRIGLNSLALRF